MNNLVVLFPALALILAATVNRWSVGNWLALLLLLIVLLLPWGFFVRWFLLHDQRSWDYLFLFFPAFTILGLYWTRWWFIRPPRTWLDHVRANPG
jgi:ACR3 family arsenite efflux pump ArsB